MEHEDAKMCIRFRNVKANVALDIGQGVAKRNLLARADEGALAILGDTIRQIVDVGVTLAEDAGAKQRPKEGSIDAARPGNEREPSLREYCRHIVSSLS